MEIYFKFTASYVKVEQDAKGNDKQVKYKDTFLVKSTTLYTDAEAKAIEACNKIGDASGINVDTLTKSNIINVYDKHEGGNWYEVTMSLQWEDDKGKTKSENHVDLIRGNDIKEAITNIEKEYGDSMDEYIIKKVVESKVLDVF